MRRMMCFLVMSLLLVSISTVLAAQEQPFFAGKTIRIIVGYGPGGGFDTFARLVARHIPRHISGNPTVIVQNMSGAGGAVAFNYVYSRAKPDGLTWVTSDGALILSKILELPGPEFDAEKYPWLGVGMSSHRVCIVMTRTGITSAEQFLHFREPVRLAATSPGDAVHIIPAIMSEAVGANFKIIVGYDGTADMRMALQAGEADGQCSSWESMKVKAADMLARNDAIPVLQCGYERHLDLPDVPNIFDFPMSEEAKVMLKLVIGPGILAKLYAVPPGTPPERLKALRQAFADTLKDPGLLAEAQKMKLPISYKSPDEVTEIIRGMMATPPELKKKVAKIAGAK